MNLVFLLLLLFSLDEVLSFQSPAYSIASSHQKQRSSLAIFGGLRLRFEKSKRRQLRTTSRARINEADRDEQAARKAMGEETYRSAFFASLIRFAGSQI